MRNKKKYETEYIEDSGTCQICQNVGEAIKLTAFLRDYISEKQEGRTCKTVQTHPRSLTVCRKCLYDLKAVIGHAEFQYGISYKDMW